MQEQVFDDEDQEIQVGEILKGGHGERYMLADKWEGNNGIHFLWEKLDNIEPPAQGKQKLKAKRKAARRSRAKNRGK